MTVYVIAQLKFTDKSRYRQYQENFLKHFPEIAMNAICADEDPQPLENWSGDKVVILKFDSEEDARRFQTDPLYQEISQDRHAGAETSSVMVKGLR